MAQIEKIETTERRRSLTTCGELSQCYVEDDIQTGKACLKPFGTEADGKKLSPTQFLQKGDVRYM